MKTLGTHTDAVEPNTTSMRPSFVAAAFRYMGTMQLYGGRTEPTDKCQFSLASLNRAPLLSVGRVTVVDDRATYRLTDD